MGEQPKNPVAVLNAAMEAVNAALRNLITQHEIECNALKARADTATTSMLAAEKRCEDAERKAWAAGEREKALVVQRDRAVADLRAAQADAKRLREEADSWMAQVEEGEARIATLEAQVQAANAALLRMQGISAIPTHEPSEVLAAPEGVEVGQVWRGKTQQMQAITGRVERISTNGKIVLEVLNGHGSVKRGDRRYFDGPMFLLQFERQQ